MKEAVKVKDLSILNFPRNIIGNFLPNLMTPRGLKRVVESPDYFRIFTFLTPRGGEGGSSDPLLANYQMPILINNN